MTSRRHHLSPQPPDELRRVSSAPHADFEAAMAGGSDGGDDQSASDAQLPTRLAAALRSQAQSRSAAVFASSTAASADLALSDRALQQSALGMDRSMWSAAFNLTNVVTGSGIVGLPYAALQCGLLVAVVLLLVTAAATHYSLQLLVRAAHRLHRKRALDMEDVMHECFGASGRWAALLAVFFLDLGVMVTLLIVIGDTVPPVCAHYFGSAFDALTSRRVVLSLVATVFVLPLSSAHSLSSLALVSLTSVASVLLLTAIVVVRALSASGGATQSPVQLVGSNVLSGFGSIAFVFVCQDVSLQLFQSMRVRSPAAWQRVSTASVAIALLPILTLTVVGYACFAEATHANVLKNFSSDDSAINVSRLVLAVSMCLTYPSNLFMCRLVLIRAIQSSSSSSSSAPSASSLHYPLTAALFAVSLLIALAVEDLGVVQSVVGSVCAVAVAFLIPGACAIQVAHKSGQPYASWANGGPWLLIVFGLSIVVLTVVTQIAELFAADKADVVHTANVH